MIRQIWSRVVTFLSDHRTIAVIWFANAAWSLAFAVMTTQHWMAIFDAAIFGFSFGNGISTLMMKRYRDAFEAAREVLEHMTEFNHALIGNRVRFIIGEAKMDDDDDQPTIN